MYRVYWTTKKGYAQEEFFETKEQRNTLIHALKQAGIEFGWEKIKRNED